MNSKLPRTKNNSQIPDEYKDVASTSDVNALEARVDKCYSEEDFSKFQTAVEKIVISTLGSDEGRTKIKSHAKESAQEYVQGIKEVQKNFLTPNIIAGASAAISLISVIVAIIIAVFFNHSTS